MLPALLRTGQKTFALQDLEKLEQAEPITVGLGVD